VWHADITVCLSTGYWQVRRSASCVESFAGRKHSCVTERGPEAGASLHDELAWHTATAADGTLPLETLYELGKAFLTYIALTTHAVG
jgi:hypothetical protein